MTESQHLSGSHNSYDCIVQQSNGVRCNETGRSNNESVTKRILCEDHTKTSFCCDIHCRNEPPDGGTRAWLVMISAFICNGVVFGIINTYGVIHALLTDYLTTQGDTEASSKAEILSTFAFFLQWLSLKVNSSSKCAFTDTMRHR